MFLFLFLQVFGGIHAQYQQQYTTPVPILKQINRQNYDGSYSYGYEGADGSFKLEVKLPNGEVYGKYGYRDEQGQVREIKYGAGDRGFEPSGNDINVPPPTLSKEYLKEERVVKKKKQFVIQPQVDDYVDIEQRPQLNTRPQQFHTEPQQPQYQQQQQYQQPQQQYQQPQYRQPQQQQYQEPQYQQPQPQYQPQYQSKPVQPQYNSYKQPAYHPNQLPYTPEFFHPALKNLDLISGSYSLDYSGRK